MKALCGHALAPRRATLVELRHDSGAVLDQALALYFPNPASFTGEDVLELHCHGGPVLLDLVLHRILALGARPANPGEFSERAFLNNKLDLAQAEAIADLIDSQTERAALSAARSLTGEFSRRVQDLADRMMDLRVYVEAAIDFPEEEVDFLSEGDVSGRLRHLLDTLEATITAAQRGRLLREGLKLVIGGRPNAGKSSLLNALAGQDAAIVTDVPGTTRDILREHIQIHGIPLLVVDTAGLRASDDPIEQEGVRRARQELASADHILIVVDGVAAPPLEHREDLLPWLAGTELRADVPLTVVRNKADLNGESCALVQKDSFTEIVLSALTGDGMDLLRNHLAGAENEGVAGVEGMFSARRRQVDALLLARAHVSEAATLCSHSGDGELVAEELKAAQQALGVITGAVHSDALLGAIFSSFCIGK